MLMRCGIGVGFVLIMAGLSISAAEVRFDARTLFEKSVSQDLKLTDDGRAIELAVGELVEDDGPAAGYSYKPNEEKLSDTVWIKKELVIADPRADSATLLVAPGGTLRFVVNGRPCDLEGAGKAGQYWQAYKLPPDLLKIGVNDIVISGAGKVWIARDDEYAAGSRDRTRHPDRSARSADAGKTWDRDKLGPAGTIDGEYYVRVFLHRHKSRGTLTLPVFDAGNLAANALAPHLASPGPVRVAVEANSGVAVRLRSGPTPSPEDKAWSAWHPFGEDPSHQLAGRYLQIELELTTSDPKKTPRLRGLTIETQPQLGSPWTENVRATEVRNEPIIRTAIPSAYEPFDQPRLKQLRTQYRLDEVVRGAKGEMDLLGRLAAWSATRWEKGHLHEAYPPWDALEILKDHKDGRCVGGFCQQSNVVFLQAAESFGFVGRAVSIGPGPFADRLKVGGHEVVEIWSNEHHRWVYIDGNTGWYFEDEGGQGPLSLSELRRRQLRLLKGEPFRPVKLVKVAETKYAWKGLEAWPPFVELRLIPRSNFLEEKSPLPLNQGMRGWFWTGHHVWTDADAPAAALYGHRVTRPGNFEWTLNQAQVTLEATETPGELIVFLDTVTPGFDTFLADVDGQGPKPVSSGFVWKLKAGLNRLTVVPRNKAGRVGHAGRVTLEYR